MSASPSEHVFRSHQTSFGDCSAAKQHSDPRAVPFASKIASPVLTPFAKCRAVAGSAGKPFASITNRLFSPQANPAEHLSDRFIPCRVGTNLQARFEEEHIVTSPFYKADNPAEETND